MARKKTSVKRTTEEKNSTVQEQPNRSALKTGKIVLFLMGFLLYATTLSYDYVLDDKIAITGNQITKKGFSGIVDQFKYDSMDGFWADQYGVSVEDLNKDAVVTGGRYRPLSMVTFSIEWGIFGHNPAVSHLINALLYGLTGLLLFAFLGKIMPAEEKKPLLQNMAFWITALYLLHPLHIEVVANIKSRDEIMSFLFGVWSLDFVMKYMKNKDRKELTYAGGLLFLSLLSKETTIAFVAVAPLMMYFFTSANKADYKMVFTHLLGASIVYILLRTTIIGGMSSQLPEELMNNPFLYAGPGEKMATIVLIFAAYIKLLFFPYPLTHDYYPFHLPFLTPYETYATWSMPATILGLVLLSGLVYLILKGWKNKNTYAFLALLFLGTSVLTSNLFFPVGVFMNERFMYIPSLAFVWALVYFLFVTLPANRKGTSANFKSGVLIIVLLGYFIIDISRIPVWKSDSTLSLTDVKVSEGSAKANMGAGDALLKLIEKERNPEEKKRMINEAYTYLKRSLEIHPDYFPPLDLLGKLYYEAGNYKESVKFYASCAQRKPTSKNFIDNIFYIGNKLVQEHEYEQATEAYNKALEFQPNNVRILMAQAEVFARYLQNPSRARDYMERAYTVEPTNVDVIEKLGITYAMLGQFEKAIPLLEKTRKAKPNDAGILKNLGVAYYQSGNTQKGLALIKRSEEMQKNTQK